MTAAALQRRIMICGLGGQGILFLSRVMADAAMRDGEEVLMAETHGMAQRGGAVEAHLKLGDFRSSLVRPGSADVVMVLHPTRVEAALPLLAPGGLCFANAPEPLPGAQTVDAGAAARSLEYPQGQNLILLGFAVTRAPELFPSLDALIAALEAVAPEAARLPNQTSLDRGIELAGIERAGVEPARDV